MITSDVTTQKLPSHLWPKTYRRVTSARIKALWWFKIYSATRSPRLKVEHQEPSLPAMPSSSPTILILIHLTMTSLL